METFAFEARYVIIISDVGGGSIEKWETGAKTQGLGVLTPGFEIPD
jgi:hypothetical protein